MRKQKKILFFILLLILVAVSITIFVIRKNTLNYTEIHIKYSDLSIHGGLKNFTITDKEIIKKIANMCKKLDSAEDEDVSKTIINNYIITLGNGNTIYMDSTIYNYGYIKRKNSEDLEFIKLPDGLLNYIKEIVSNG